MRRNDRAVEKVFSGDTQEAKNEAVEVEAALYLEIDRQNDPKVLQHLQENLLRILKDVRVAVKDWQPMRERVTSVLSEIQTGKFPIKKEEVAESYDFLHWMLNEHFTFLGVQEYRLGGHEKNPTLVLQKGSGLGLFNEKEGSESYALPKEETIDLKQGMQNPSLLVISKTPLRSTVHRLAYMDCVGVRWFDEKGSLKGELRIFGLYTSAAYNSNPKHIPFLRQKVETVMANSKLRPHSHSGKALLNILETLPRDELFQASAEELTEIAMGILHLQERQRLRIFLRKDVYHRFVSCLVYAPRERVDTELRRNMHRVLLEHFHAREIIYSTYFSDSLLARVHYTVYVDPASPIPMDVTSLENKLVEVARSWRDDFRAALVERWGEEKGLQLYREYQDAFPSAYREDFSPMSGVFDVERLQQLGPENTLEMSFYRSLNDTSSALRLKLFSQKEVVPLSDVLPILENMGLRVISERPYVIAHATQSWLDDFSLSHAKEKEMNVENVRSMFQEAFLKVWFKEVENDGFNRLILGAEMNWRQVNLLRSYYKYLRQTGFTFSQSYVEETLVKHASIARNIVQWFEARFNPLEYTGEAPLRKMEMQVYSELESVTNLDEDRILRRFLDVVRATLRTNYFQTTPEGHAKNYLSFKIDPKKVPEIPLPLPMFEIFVYSSRFKGVHLRGAKVARGGIRWSDRREDVRTEILGLMKAQRVKNAVIVPSGAKGGFVVKSAPVHGTRDEIMAEVVQCYQSFIRGLLDVTDNLVNGEVVHPPASRLYDEDDPYLVVAADKGTASFSDYANAVAKEYGYWLGDAFASGGSAGYDHKKMGITARGAWESVQRHFRELGRDIQKEPCTVVGIGDMSGDVFGNGMPSLVRSNL